MSQFAANARGSHQSLRSESNRATSFQNHLSLFSLLLKGEHDGATHCLQHGPVRPHEFARFVTQHRLQLFVFSTLDGSPLRKCFPQQWLDEVERFSSRQTAAQETLVEEVMQLSVLLSGARQDFILLKGPYLAIRFFGGIHRRAFYDLDALVKREHLTEVERLLRSNGYIRKSTILFNQAVTSRFTHAFDFAKSDIVLDLHWLLSANAAHDLDYEAIWQQRQTFLLRDQRVFVLSDEYEVVFNLISVFKDLERGAPSLKSLVDLYFILDAVSRHLDWQTFFEHRQREKILRISVNVLALFLDLFECQDRFPDVAAAIARHQRLLDDVPSRNHQALIEASPGALANKLWAAGMYDCSRLHVFLWWLASLPFRLAVYHPGKYTRFKIKLKNWKRLLRPGRLTQGAKAHRNGRNG